MPDEPLPLAWALSSRWRQATVAPSSSAVKMAGTPAVPAPMTTIS